MPPKDADRLADIADRFVYNLGLHCLHMVERRVGGNSSLYTVVISVSLSSI